MKTRLISALSLILTLFSCSSINKNASPSEKEGMIDVPGGRVWYKMVGANKNGIPLLLLHGGPGIPHDYLETLEELADERPVIFYDQLGCGNSDKPSDTTLWNTARFVEELEQVRTALQLDTLHILGQSWGTMLAVEYMLKKNPNGVSSLILCGPFISAKKWIADQQIQISQLPPNIQDTIRKYEENGDFSSPSYQDAMAYFYQKHVCRMAPWPDCLNRTMEKMNSEIYEYMIGPSEFTITGTMKDVDLSDQLNKIKLPTLFTCGEFDEASPATTAFYQSKLPGSEIYIFKDASHVHHLEKKGEFNLLVRNFLKKHDAKK